MPTGTIPYILVGMIVVTGANGNVGGELVTALAGAGEKVRAVSRRPDPAGLPAGVDVAVADLNTPATLTAALDGADAAFLLGGFPDMPGILAEMRRAGVRHVVLLSSGSAVGGSETNAVARMHLHSEAAVRESGVPWTFLRSSGFMSNALQWVPQLRAGDLIREPFGDVRIAAIDPFDIAAVAAHVLRSPAGHEGRGYLITGPDSILPVERVRVLSAVLGRPLRFEAQPNAEARIELLRTTPSEYVDAFFDFFVEGSFDDSVVRPTVEELLGRRPRSFTQWAEAHAGAFG